MTDLEISAPAFYTGSPISPPDLWFRDEFISGFWEILDRQHAVISAPRRTGKTSVMDHLAEFPQSDFTVVPVFVQDLDHPAEFVLTLLDEFHDRHPKLFRNLFGKGKQFFQSVLQHLEGVDFGGFKVSLREQDPDWKRNWKKHGDHFFQQVRAQSKRILFIVDEFPDFIINTQKENPETLSAFLGWFRGHRQKPNPGEDPIRWLLGGSVNLSSTLDSIGCLDQINDLHDEELPVLNDSQVETFVTRMLTGRRVEFAASVPKKVRQLLGRPIPLFLQMLTQDLYLDWKRHGKKLTSKNVETAFGSLVVSSGARDKLQHYYSRIDRYYVDPQKSAAYQILAELSLSADGLSRDKLRQIYERVLSEQDLRFPAHERAQRFNQLLRDLENDFYIAEIDDDRFDFSSGLLKTWWKKYYA